MMTEPVTGGGHAQTSDFSGRPSGPPYSGMAPHNIEKVSVILSWPAPALTLLLLVAHSRRTFQPRDLLKISSPNLTPSNVKLHGRTTSAPADGKKRSRSGQRWACVPR